MAVCLSILPILACFLPLIGTVAVYLIGKFHKADNRREFYIPYPSDLMVEQPERGVYTTSLGISATLTMVVLLVRCVQVHSFFRNKCRLLNFVSLVVGISMIVGQIIVSAFPLIEYKFVHYAGAFLYFGCGSIYMILQAHISRRHPYYHSTCIIVLRIVLAILGFLPPVAYTVARSFLPKEKHRYFIPQASEWILAMLCFLYVATFAWDFGKINIDINSKEVRHRNEAGQDVFLTQEVSTV